VAHACNHAKRVLCDCAGWQQQTTLPIVANDEFGLISETPVSELMAPQKKRTKVTTLAHGRPPKFRPAPSLSRKAAKTLIRTHHTLEKAHAKALAAGDTTAATKISREIDKNGGIKMYQRASLLGQANDRGGDSSKILMDWLKAGTCIRASSAVMDSGNGRILRMLEVGALSTSNACSRSGLFEIKRIDLNSQAEGITQQDFMARPFPNGPSEQFDIISLSLVINFVPDPAGRGEMLERTLRFLRKSSFEEQSGLQECFPSLFLVLPVSCVTNSRYLDDARLEAIMQALGYEIIQQKLSNKLAYYLWRATNLTLGKRTDSFKKVEVRAGRTRNNFAIVLK
jgi:25S rRNA (adenine2142-N1)-methyltransferase